MSIFKIVGAKLQNWHDNKTCVGIGNFVVGPEIAEITWQQFNCCVSPPRRPRPGQESQRYQALSIIPFNDYPIAIFISFPFFSCSETLHGDLSCSESYLSEKCKSGGNKVALVKLDQPTQACRVSQRAFKGQLRFWRHEQPLPRVICNTQVSCHVHLLETKHSKEDLFKTDCRKCGAAWWLLFLMQMSLRESSLGSLSIQAPEDRLFYGIMHANVGPIVRSGLGSGTFWQAHLLWRYRGRQPEKWKTKRC